MDQTFFYIAGGALVVLALIISMIGLRSEGFPSNGILAAGVGLMAAVVILTAAAAVSSSGEEKDVNAEASANAASQAATNEETGGGGSASGSSAEPSQPASGQGDDSNASGASPSAADGATVFASNGCGGCHTLTAASSTGQVGPNLDEALVDKDPAFIKTSIIDPSAVVEKGFPDDLMPKTFGDQISPEDLDALVAYLAQSTSGK